MPAYPSFCYGSYPSQSPIADLERTMNWYPEPIESPGSTWQAALYPTPGQQSFIAAPSVSDVNTRALFSMSNRTHGVVGGGIYELFQTNTATRRGPCAQDNYPAQIAYNGQTGNQLLISSGTNGYLVDLTTNLVTQVLSGDATMVGMIDTYFLAFNIVTSRFRWSGLNDGTTWNALNFQSRSIAPDPWQAMVVDGNRQIWLIGEQTGEVWYDAGTSPSPFAPIPGAVFGYGTPAPFTVKVAGDRMIWLSKSVDGAGIVVAARGYSPERVSNYAIETAIAAYQRTSMITDAEAFVYQDQGHVFYVLNFPSANATWVLDTSTGVWHQRGKWNAPRNDFDVWGPRVHAYAFGQHLVGDRSTGTIATMDVSYGSEVDGKAIRRVRIPAPIWCRSGVRRMFINRFQVRAEPGLGTSTGQGVSPSMMLRTSRNAKTWSNERAAAAGAIGGYGQRVFWTRCGSSPDLWVPEITVTDPIPWRIVGADIEGQGFALPQQRAA